MKLIHLSDLHLGKRVNEFSMIEDQKYILNEILRIIDEEAPDGILLAGDLYDRPVPSAEAVQLFDRFLTRLAKRKLPVYAISGNHDSGKDRFRFTDHEQQRDLYVPGIRWKNRKVLFNGQLWRSLDPSASICASGNCEARTGRRRRGG